MTDSTARRLLERPHTGQPEAEREAERAVQLAALTRCEWAVMGEGVSVHHPRPGTGPTGPVATVVVELKLLAYDPEGRRVVLRAQVPVALAVPGEGVHPEPGDEACVPAVMLW